MNLINTCRCISDIIFHVRIEGYMMIGTHMYTSSQVQLKFTSSQVNFTAYSPVCGYVEPLPSYGNMNGGGEGEALRWTVLSGGTLAELSHRQSRSSYERRHSRFPLTKLSEPRQEYTFASSNSITPSLSTFVVCVVCGTTAECMQRAAPGPRALY